MASATNAVSGQAADCLGFQLFHGCPGWSSLDELHLLDAIKMYGFGNWKDASAHVGKPAIECKKHYEDVYLISADAPLPQPQRFASSTEVVVRQPLDMSAAAVEAAAVAMPGAGSAVPGPKHGPDDEHLTVTGQGDRPRGRGRGGRPKSRSGGPGDPDVSGFYPLRGDFDVEWDNDAELLLADMEFRDGEHPTETELKLKVVEIYGAKLDERERRKRFVLERGLLDFKARIAEERRRPREEREIRNMLRPFARFHSVADHEALVETLMEEHRLRRRIAQLQHWRRHGVRTLAEADEYEAAKKQRALDSRARRQRESTGGGLATPLALPTSGSRARRRDRLSGRASDASEALPSAKRARAAEHSPAAPAAPSLPAPASPSAIPRAGDAAASSASAPSASSSSASFSSSSSSSASAAASEPTGPLGPLAGAPSTAAGQDTDLRPAEDEFDASSAPGAASLSEQELALCSHMRLLPSQLAAIRAAVKDAAGQGEAAARARAAAAGGPAGASEAQCAAVFDLCVSCGWVSAEPGGGTLRTADGPSGPATSSASPALPDATAAASAQAPPTAAAPLAEHAADASPAAAQAPVH